MATAEHDGTDIDSGSESDFETDIEESVSSDLKSDQSDNDSMPIESANTRDWSRSNFHPHIFPFDERNSGTSPKLNVSNCETPLDYFELLFDEKLIDFIAEETNNYREHCTSDAERNPDSDEAKWIPANRSEIYLFLAVIMLMTVIRKNKIRDYWSTDSLIATPIFGQLFARDRFMALLRYSHFNGDSKKMNEDKLHKIRPIINILRRKFSRLLIPFKNLCIDESLVLWKGRLSFRQYIPTKRHRFGIKVFVLCDCRTGAVLDFIVYTGSSTEIEYDATPGIAGSVVMTLLKPYLNDGHSLFVDNWYTSLPLFEKSHQLKTGACGTIRKNRAGLPYLHELRKGEYDYQNTNNLLVMKWRDKRDVFMLSTIHKPRMIKTGKTDWKNHEPIVKPECVVDYNKNKDAVDKVDMRISFIQCLRKTIKWYKKFFFHLLDTSTLNSYTLFKFRHGSNVSFETFRIQLIRGLIERYAQPKSALGRPVIGENPLRLTERHFPSLVPPTAAKRNAQRYCIVCSQTCKREKKRTDTRSQCAVCDVGLCVVDCFEAYHTLKHF